MSATNHTTNYNLPQYVSTDKPTYLVDFNTAMRDIDTAIHNNATNIETNATNINGVSNIIGDLSNLTTTVKSSVVGAINEVADSTATIGDLQDLDTLDKTSVVNAINSVNVVNTYSLSEQVIGVWANNKTLYRKVINTGGLPNAVVKHVAHDIANLDDVISVRGVARNSNGNRIPLPFVDDNYSNWCIEIVVNNTNIDIATNTDVTGYTESFVIIEYTKSDI